MQVTDSAAVPSVAVALVVSQAPNDSAPAESVLAAVTSAVTTMYDVAVPASALAGHLASDTATATSVTFGLSSDPAAASGSARPVGECKS